MLKLLQLVTLLLRRGSFGALRPADIASGHLRLVRDACRRQVQSTYLGDHKALCRVLTRYKFYTDTRDRSLCANLLLDGFWELWVTVAIARHVRPGMVAIDVGANFGYFSVLLADLIGPEGRLLAIEPNPVASASLRASLDLNGFLDRSRVIEAAAASTGAGTEVLLVPTGEPKNAHIVPARREIDPAAGSFVDVPRWCLDEEVADLGRVDFIKIDAEGAEEAILAGMMATLARFKPILVLEFNAARYPDPACLLDRLLAVYGRVGLIEQPDTPAWVSRDSILNEQFGQDRMLFFGEQHST